MDRLYLIGGAALLAISLAIGAYFYGRSDGTAIEKGKWEAREAVTLTETNKKISEIYATYRAKEQSWAEELQQVSAGYQKDLKNANDKNATLHAQLDSGGLRLRDSGATCNEANRSDVPGTAPAASGRDGGAGCELSKAASGFLLDLTRDADAAVNQLSACQAALGKLSGHPSAHP